MVHKKPIFLSIPGPQGLMKQTIPQIRKNSHGLTVLMKPSLQQLCVLHTKILITFIMNDIHSESPYHPKKPDSFPTTAKI